MATDYTALTTDTDARDAVAAYLREHGGVAGYETANKLAGEILALIAKRPASAMLAPTPPSVQGDVASSLAEPTTELPPHARPLVRR